MKHEHLYLLFALVGTLVPWWFFGGFFAANGVDVALFVSTLFVNGAAGGFSADVLISIAVFLYWVWQDGKVHTVPHRWLILPALFAVGLSLALPLYLYLREKTAVKRYEA